MSDFTVRREAQAADGVEIPARGDRRSWRPRFRIGLRSLLLIAVIFCLLCGWLGRNYAHIRQQDAALETLKRAGGGIGRHGDELLSSEEREADEEAWTGWLGLGQRLVGWDSQRGIRRVRLSSDGSNDPATTEAVQALYEFPEIESVVLWGPGFDDSSLIALQRLPRLETLSLLDVNVTSSAISQLKTLREIHVLDVTTRYRPDDLIEGLASLKRLRKVSLYGTELSRADIEAIASLPELESLSLSTVVLDDEDIYGPLAQAQSLRFLEMENSAFDDDMSVIAKLRGLKRLNARGISDAGLARLAPLTGLERVELGYPVTPEAARHFSAARPDCLVSYEDRRGLRQFYRWSAPVPEEALPPEDQFGYELTSLKRMVR